MPSSCRLGIDIGGTKVAAGLVDSSARLLGWSQRAARPELTAAECVAAILGQVEELLADHDQPAQRLTAVGVGFPGDFDGAGMIKTAPNLPAFVGRSPAVLFREALRGRWSLEAPVTAGNDACAAALAEARLGAGRCAGRLLYLTVSTGIGGARFDGTSPDNVEPGLSLHPDSEQPDLTLENLASGPAIAGFARREILAEVAAGGEAAEIRWRSFLDLVEVPPNVTLERRLGRLTARHLGLAAIRGDAFSRRHFERAADHVARGLALLLAEGYGEERIVIGGSVAEKVPGFVDRVRRTLAELRSCAGAAAGLLALDLERDLVAAELGEARGILGAVLLTEC